MLLYDFSLGIYAKSLAALMQQVAADPARVAVESHHLPALHIHRLQAALQPQVEDLGSITWHCLGTRPSVTARLQGPILYMVSATQLNKGSPNYAMDLGPLRQNKSLAPITQTGLQDGLQIPTD